MELQFDVLRSFEEDLALFSLRDRERVAVSIDRYVPAFDTECPEALRQIYQPHKFLLPDSLQSSLYVLRVSEKIRVILTIEDDPLFDRKLITLMRVVTQDQLDRSYRSISESLYAYLQTERRKHG